MKKYARGSNKMVMFALLAVLLISLGYLSIQGKEGMTGKKKEGLEPIAPRPKPTTQPKRETPMIPMPQ